MVSFWWVLAAFIGGGCAGVLVMALMCFAGGLPEQADVRGRAVPRSTRREVTEMRADAAAVVFETSKYWPVAIGAVVAEPCQDCSSHLAQ